MTHCPRCRAALASPSPFCPYCGVDIGTGIDDAAPTIAPARTPHPGDAHRFAPGTLLGGRYRVLERLGRGGMGEVYRAIDLKLDHPVALKFLPVSTAQDPQAVERFYDEVRMARQVSHPNVCRVYDLGELDGSPYMSMEYIDGEDLGTLLRRIGRLPGDKAVEIARRLCAGLAAAHAKGVLHRDLKPSNIMLDASGQVLIMDFGLAAVSSRITGPEIRSGTPAYMSPEQLEGREVTERSDIFAVGAVLYEVVTGRRAFNDGDRSSAPNPATFVKDIDPVFERVVMRCLDPDPARRPASALLLARALPGGDPLAEALAAGDTPSPAMVAAAEHRGVLSVKAVGTYVGGALLALVVIIALGRYTSIVQLTPFPDPPEVLAGKARDLAERFGYTRPPVDTAYEFLVDGEYRGWAERNLSSADYRRQVRDARPSLPYFEYREAQQLLQPRSPDMLVSADDPSIRFGDMVEVRFDPLGRLRFLRGVPMQRETPSTGARVDWDALLRAAGLEPAEWDRTESQYVPPFAFDERVAWTGTYPGQPSMPMRIEAAGWRGRPTYFILVGPWSRPIRDEPTPRVTLSQRVAQIGGLALLVTVLSLAGALAWSNYRRDRGDVRGASRLAVFAAACGFLQWLVEGHHTFTAAALQRVGDGVGISLVEGTVLWVMYLALEPHVRRRWPLSLISWTRLLAGDVRDPLVAGHILVGLAFGLGFAALLGIEDLFGWQRGLLRASGMELSALSGIDRLVARGLDGIVAALLAGLGFFFLFFLLRVLLRRNWAASLVFVALFATLAALPSAQPLMSGAFAALQTSAALFVMTRFGVLPLVVVVFLWSNAHVVALGADITAWYAARGIGVTLVLVGLIVWGFRASLGGRPVFSDSLLDD